MTSPRVMDSSHPCRTRRRPWRQGRWSCILSGPIPRAHMNAIPSRKGCRDTHESKGQKLMRPVGCLEATHGCTVSLLSSEIRRESTARCFGPPRPLGAREIERESHRYRLPPMRGQSATIEPSCPSSQDFFGRGGGRMSDETGIRGISSGERLRF